MSEKKEQAINSQKIESIEDKNQLQKQQQNKEQKIQVEQKEQNHSSLQKELLQMGFDAILIKEAIKITQDKEKAIQFIITSMDQNDDGMKLMNDEKKDDSESMNEFKMVFLVRMDLKMGLGKIAAQVGHATLRAYKQMEQMMGYHQNYQFPFFKWTENGQKKIVLKVPNQEALLTIVNKAQAQKINNCYIRDAGLTQIQAGSITVAALGPASDQELKNLTGHLKLL